MDTYSTRSVSHTLEYTLTMTSQWLEIQHGSAQLSGYVALAPDLFWRQAPRIELDYTDADRQRGIALMQQIDLTETLADLGAALAVLRARAAYQQRAAALALGRTLTFLAEYL